MGARNGREAAKIYPNKHVRGKHAHSAIDHLHLPLGAKRLRTDAKLFAGKY